MNRLGIIRYVLYSSLVLLTLFLIGVGLLYSSLLFRKGENEDIISKPTYEYQILEYDSTLEERTLGMVTLLRPIDGPYDFREDMEGNYVLISNFGDEEYECTGICSCEKEEFRRSASSTLRKPMFYLLAAMTSAVAYEFAEKYFEEKCFSEMIDSDDCVDRNSITSEVLECKESTTEIVEEGEGEDDGLEKRYYQCKGFCKPARSFQTFFEENTDIFDYTQMLEKLDTCYKSEFSTGNRQIVLNVPAEMRPGEANKMAQKKFFETQLDLICRDINIDRSFIGLRIAVRNYEEEIDLGMFDEESYKKYKKIVDKVDEFRSWYENSEFDDQGDISKLNDLSICRGNVETVNCRKSRRKASLKYSPGYL